MIRNKNKIPGVFAVGVGVGICVVSGVGVKEGVDVGICTASEVRVGEGVGVSGI